MRRDEAIARLRAHAHSLTAAGIRALHLFGSTARDEAGHGSDIDLFVDPDYERFGFVELIRTEALLKAKLGLPVDLTTRDGLHPLLRAGIERTPRRTIQLRGFGRRFDAARSGNVIGPAFWQADDGRERAQGPIPSLPQAATGRASIQRKRLRL